MNRDRTKVALAARLRERRAEIEQAALARVRAIADPTEISDPSYVDGLRTAVTAALDFALATIESSEDRPPLVPPVLLFQARLAARHRVSLDTVLRRYTAGHALLTDFLIREAEEEGLRSPNELRRLLGAISATFDRLLATVSEEYAREAQSRSQFSRELRRAERVERLLAAEPIDASGLAYDFDGWQLGLVGSGKGVEAMLRALCAHLNCRTLVVSHPHGDGVVWAWLGGRRRIDAAQVAEVPALADREQDVSIAIGEPGEGLSGWRLSHRQALAALPVAQRTGQAVVLYADVALLASALQDDLLAVSLRRLYLEPLCTARDESKALREALRAYFATGRNISSAAAAVGINRNTIANRLRVVEEHLPRPLASCAAELEVALRLDALGEL